MHLLKLDLSGVPVDLALKRALPLN